MRLIDADKLKEEVLKQGTTYILTLIDNAPTVDISTYASKQRAYKEGKYDGFMTAPYGDD